MRRPPPVKDFPKYPIVGGTILMAIGVTLAVWSGKVDVNALAETVDIRRGQLWRIFTSTLPHGDILHLAFNVYWTWVFGTLIEEVYGHLKTFGIFVLLALIANGSEYAVLEGGIGLSGIGYGLFGLLWALSRRDRRFADAIDKNTIGLFVIWFFFCVFLTISGTPIANVAHGVGAVAGGLLGMAISGPFTQRTASAAGLALLAIATLAGVTVARPWINVSKNRGYDEARLGYEDLIAGKNQESLRWYLDATRMRPSEPGFWFNLGITYDRLNRHSEAVTAFKRACELDPSKPEYKEAASEE